MTLHQVRIFQAVAKHQNVTKASQELHLSQSAVSRQLKLLQEEVEMELYKIAGQGIRLTEAGQVFLGEAELVLSAAAKLGRMFRPSVVTDAKPRTLAIGATRVMSAYLLPQLIGIFLRSHPDIAVNVRSGTSRDIECLAEGFEIEVGVVTNPSNSPLLIYELWQQAKLVTFLSEKHPWARKRRLSLEELGTAPLIMMNTKTSLHSLELVKKLTGLGITPNIVMQSESPEGILMAVKSGVGLGICYREIVASVDFKCAGLKIIEVPMLDLTFTSFITYPKNRILSDSAQAFLKILRRWRYYRRPLNRFLRAA